MLLWNYFSCVVFVCWGLLFLFAFPLLTGSMKNVPKINARLCHNGFLVYCVSSFFCGVS